MNFTVIIVISAIVSLGIAAGLACIPASIARNKGYSFGLWWFYGWMLFIIALIHVSLIPDKNAQQYQQMQNSNMIKQSKQNIADEISKYKQLYDQGVITEEEFNTKKEQLLKLI